MKASIKIRNAVPIDSLQLERVLRQTWLSTYIHKNITAKVILASFGSEEKKVKQLSKFLSEQPADSRYFVAEVDGKIIGACFGHETEPGAYKLKGLYILPEYQKMGVGRKLLNEFESSIHAPKGIFLEVASFNEKAISFYSKHGFSYAKKYKYFVFPEKKRMRLMVYKKESKN